MPTMRNSRVRATLKHFFCLLVLSQCSRAAWLRCYRGSLSNYLAIPLDKPLVLTGLSCINPTLPTVFYTFGYRGRVSGPATTAVLSAYLATKKRNVVLLDWEQEAKSGMLGVSLGYALFAVPNAKKVGEQFGQALVRLAHAGMNMTQTHLLGHSLGAHLMANAGRYARKNGYVIPRITGLDPARALYEGSFALQKPLDKTCARFVDIIHTDSGGYGTSRPTGTVDIWPNYAGTGVPQPGCRDGSFDAFSKDDLCSHDRAWRYFAEAIAAPTSFMAVAAPDPDHWLNGNFDNHKNIFLGDLTSTRALGNFFLTTESRGPFAKGPDGMRPDGRQPRRRRNPAFTRLLKFLR